MTILELAQQRRMATGNVTTAELTDATPAARMSHVRLRACQGPLNMSTCPQDLKSVGDPARSQTSVSTPLVILPPSDDREGRAPTEPSTDRDCVTCGYGVAVDPPPPACPMCGAGAGHGAGARSTSTSPARWMIDR